MVATKQFTAEDLWELRHEPDKLDVIDGELFRMPGAGGTHGRVGSTINARLHDFVEQRDLGVVYTLDTGFILERNPDTTLCPDIAFVKKDRVPPEEDELRFLDLAPDLAVEIVSPNDTRPFVLRKVAKYFANGTGMVWAVFLTSRTVEVHRPNTPVAVLGLGDVLAGGELLPGFAVRVSELFPARSAP